MMNDMELLEVRAFCDWFIQNNESLINAANSESKEALDCIDIFESSLTKVFNRFYKGKVKFGYGFDHKVGKWTLDLCHLNKKNLVQITKLIKENLSGLSDRWVINISR